MKEANIKVLLTTASGPGMSGIIHSLKSHPLKNIEIIAGTVEEDSSNISVFSDRIIKIPYANSDNYVNDMLSICLENKVDLIISGFSDENTVLSKYKSAFENKNIKILCPSHENIYLCHNKNKLYEKLEELDSEYLIPYKTVDSLEELKNACIAFGYPSSKVCIKPAVCNGGSRGFFIIDEKYDRYQELFAEKSTNLCSLDELTLKFKNIKVLPKLLVMKYIEGQEYGIDVVAKNGEVIAYTIRKIFEPRLANICMKVETVESKEIDKLIRKITKQLKLNCIFNMDIICRDREMYLIEINPRQSSFIGVSTPKINLLAIAIDLLYKEVIDVDLYKGRYNQVTGLRYIEEFCMHNNEIIIYKK